MKGKVLHAMVAGMEREEPLEKHCQHGTLVLLWRSGEKFLLLTQGNYIWLHLA
ncbi:MAG: hypothetical protein ACYDBT_02605 [Desulfobulbaceae bacterium]